MRWRRTRATRCGPASSTAQHAAVVARRLMADDVFSGFGLRTLATGMGRYDPVSYHNGSVWPHDTAITAVGLARNGFHKDALRLVEGLVAASSDEDGRLPELFSGLSRRDVDSPGAVPDQLLTAGLGRRVPGCCWCGSWPGSSPSCTSVG